jgi:transcriptional regulator NrdR family protein
VNCPKCGFGFSTVIECRMVSSEKRVRKQCAGCGFRYTLYEVIDLEYNRLKKNEKTVRKILSLMEELKSEN